MRILCVEDNNDSLELLKVFLEGSGYEVSTATNGIEALDAARKSRPDIIVSDIMMPEMDGFVLCRKIKGDKSLKDIPFIFYTATYLDPKDKELGLSLGASRYLEKPMELSELLKVIDDVMEEVRSSQMTGQDAPRMSEHEIDNVYQQALVRKLEKKIAELEEQYEISKQSQQMLRQSESRVRSLLNSTAEAIYGLDLKGNCTFCNPACIEMLGYEQEDDLIGQRMHDKIHHTRPDGEPYPAKECMIYKAFQEGERAHVDDELLWRKDGTSFPAEYWSHPVYQDGKITGSVVTFLNITDRKTIEEQLRQSQKMEAIGKLTGGIAHDFNNLLTIARGNTTLLKDSVDENEEAREFIEEIEGAIDRGALLTDRLLAFSRQQALLPCPTEINGLILDLKSMLQRALGEAVELHICLRSETCKALIDPHQLENALINLAINARDAMPKGGGLTIETDNVVLNEDYIKQYEDLTPGDYIMIAVSDVGVGMTPEVQGKAFEPFFTTKGANEGSGLGLSMVYGFVKQSRGHIAIYSEEGHGTTVKLYIPQFQEAMAQKDTKNKTHEFALGSKCILVIEDDARVRKVLVRILHNQGYEITEATDGKGALEHLQSGQIFDLLLTDVMLPGGINGVGIAKKAKLIQPNIKVLYASGYAKNFLYRNEKLDPNATMISKPYNQEELLKKVRGMLDSEDG